MDSSNPVIIIQLEKIWFTSLNNGIVIGNSGIILKTSIGGTNWYSVSSPVNTNLTDLQFINPTTGWILGQNGRILKTTDGGETWFSQNSPSTNSLNAISMVDLNTGYIVGSNGTLLKTTNGGGGVLVNYFQKITVGPIVTDANSSNHASWVDFDNDSDLDVLITQYNNNCWSCTYPILMYRNNGDGTFTSLYNNITQLITRTLGCPWGDYDNDGKIDVFLNRIFNENNLLFRNLGNGNFSMITNEPLVQDGAHSPAAAWCDYDRDGWIDLFVTVLSNGNNLLYHNNGNGSFTRIMTGSIVNDGGDSRSCAWGDYDNDGWHDLFVVNYSNQNDFLYRNNGNGTFTRILNAPMVNDGDMGSGCTWSDFNNDGRLDLFITNNGHPNQLYINNGNGNFTVSSSPPSNYTGMCYNANWCDYDNDGWLDLFVPTWSGYNLLYRNISGTTFTNITNEIVVNDPSHSECGVWGDYNNDGKIDLLVTNSYGTIRNALYQNVGTTDNYLICKLTGCTGYSNKSAIGARIKIKIGSLQQIREVTGGFSLGATNMFWQHFGVGSAFTIDSIIVYWPSGLIQRLANITSNQTISINECNAVGILNNEIPVSYHLSQNYPNPFNPVTTIEYSIIKPCVVKISVYDAAGKYVTNLVNEFKYTGNHKVEFDASDYASGLYIYKMETPEFSKVNKMVLVK